jgi:hypothetical protein
MNKSTPKERTTRLYSYVSPSGKIKTVVRNYEVIDRSATLPEFNIEPGLRRKDIHEKLSSYMKTHQDILKNTTYKQIAEHINKNVHVMSQYNIAKLWNAEIGNRNRKMKKEDAHPPVNENNE